MPTKSHLKMNGVSSTKVNYSSHYNQHQSGDDLNADDRERRMSALENSKELYDIYQHPQWIKLMQLVKNAKSSYALHRLRVWVATHHQLAPIVAWFTSCTRKYGFTFDAFTCTPNSLLGQQEHCRERIAYHMRMIDEHQQQLHDLQEGLHCPVRHSTDGHVAAVPALRTCWDVLVACNTQQSIATMEPWRHHSHGSGSVGVACSVRDLSTHFDPEPEPLILPPAVTSTM